MKISFFGCLLAASTAALSLSESEIDSETNLLSATDLEENYTDNGLSNSDIKTNKALLGQMLQNNS